MKKKDRNDLKTKDVADLKKMLADLRKDLVREKIELKMGNVKNVHATKNIKRRIANVLTFITLREKIEINKVKKEEESTNKSAKETRKENK